MTISSEAESQSAKCEGGRSLVSSDVGAAGPFEWIGPSAGRPGDAEAVALWAQRVFEDDSSNIYMLPQFSTARSPAPDVKPPLVYGVWNKAAPDESQPTSLAVLSPRTLACGGLPGLPWGKSISTAKLVGDTVLIGHDENAMGEWIDTLVDLLRRGVTESIHFEEVEVDSALWKALANLKSRHAKAYYPLEPQPHWWIDFPADNPADYWKKYSGKDRRKMGQQARHFEHELIRLDRPDQAGYFLEQSAAVASASWQGKRLGGRIEASAENQRMMEKLAACGAMRNYLLQTEGKSVAYITVTQWQDFAIAEETGYDLSCSKLKPGQVLIYRMIEDMIQHKTPRCISMGFGDATYKKHIGTRSTMTAPVILARRSIRPTLCLGIDLWRKRTSRAARKMLSDTSLMKLIRKKYRG